MYKKVSEEFTKLIEQQGGRTFKIKLESSSFVIDSGIKKIVYTGGSNAGDSISVGSAVSNYIEVIMEKVPHLLTGQQISFHLGLEVNGVIEYVPIGIFKANKPEMTDYEITFKAYDRMTQAEKNYASDLKYPTDTVKVMKEIAQKLGIEFVTDISPITLNNPNTEEGSSNVVFAGYTIREAIGYIAGLYGKFAIFNRAGQLEFKWYEDNGFEVPVSKCYSFTKNESDYTVKKIIGTAADDTQYEAGSGITGISFSNPFVTQEIVNKIHTEIGGFTYRGGETKFLGDCRIDVWDILTGEDLFGNSYKLPVMEITHKIDGGLTTTVKAKTSESESVEDTFKGPVVKAMERTHAQLLLVNNLIASKASIEYLEANYIKTNELDAVTANIENAVITNLQGKFASIEYLEANYAAIDFANVEKATIGTMLADVGLISSATIIDGHVTGFLDAVKVNASNITAGVLDAGNIEVVNLKAASITVGQINGYQIAPGAIDMDNLAESITNEIDAASSNAQTALDEAMKAFNESQAAALAAGAAQATADGKNTVYYQTTEPTGAKKNDIWFNTMNDNQMSIYDGTKWIAEQFGAGAIADNAITANQIATEVNNQIDNAFTNAGSALAAANAANTAASDALNAFNNLEIGGRNLFPKSKCAGIINIPDTISGYGIILQQSSTNIVIQSKQLDTVLFNIGKTYTIQFVAWSDGDTILSCDIYPDTYGNSMGLPNDTGVAVTTTKQKYVFTGKLENSNGLVSMYLRFWRLAKNSNYKIYISDIMIEAGNKASTWTPAPEDLESEINFAQSTADGKNTVYYQTTAPSGGTYKVNDTWFDTDDGNKMYYWNGSAWTVRQFGTNAIANASITNALIADATIQSAKIANLDAAKITSGYIDAARIKAGTITLGQLNTSVQNTINGAAQQIYHSTNAGAGTGGYFYLAQIKISMNYATQPIKIGIVSRHNIPSTVWITFANANNTDPGILRFAKTGTANFYLVKAAAGTWNLYVGKSEGYDSLSVTEFEKGAYMSGVSVTWQSTMVTTLPNGYITAAQTIATAEWCYNNDITYINGGKLYTGTVVAAAIAASAITTDKLAANAVTAAKMAVGTITAASGIIANAAIQTANIADLAVTGAKLANATIGTAKIADAAITSAKIANLAVTNAKIADATIQSAKIANLDAAKITTGTLLADRIGANTITANKIAIADFTNYATANENFASANIPTTTFGGTSISGGYIVKPASSNQYLMFCDYTPCNLKNGEQIYYEMSIKGAVSGSVTPSIWYYNANHGNNTGYNGTTKHSIGTTETVISGTITVSSTADSAYYFLVGISDNNSSRNQIYVREVKFIRKNAGNLIVDGAITAAKLSANAVTAGKINAGAVTAGTIASGAITTDKLAANAVTAAKIASRTITADRIVSSAITATEIATSAITTDKLAANSIIAAKIASGAITADKIAAGAVTATKISVTDLSALNAKIGGWTIASTYIGNSQEGGSIYITSKDDNVPYWIRTHDAANGGGTITFSVSKTGELYAAKGKIAGFKIDSNSIYNGTWGNSGSVMMCTGSEGAKSIGGSANINGWCFTAGNKFGVTKEGNVYLSSAEITGGDINLTSGETQSKINVRFSTRPATYTSISPRYTWLYHNADEYMRLSGYAGGSIVMHRDNADVVKINAVGGITANSINSTGGITSSGNIVCNGSLTVKGNGLELYYSTPYIDFHAGSSSADYTARIIEASYGALKVYNSISNASDKKLKKDIKPLSNKYISVLDELKPSEYRFIKGDEYLNLGFIAQDVAEALKKAGINDMPLVSKGDDGIYALDYNGIIPILVLGYQKQKEKLKEQEKKIQYLENMVTHLIGIAMNPERVETYQI